MATGIDLPAAARAEALFTSDLSAFTHHTQASAEAALRRALRSPSTSRQRRSPPTGSRRRSEQPAATPAHLRERMLTRCAMTLWSLTL